MSIFTKNTTAIEWWQGCFCLAFFKFFIGNGHGNFFRILVNRNDISCTKVLEKLAVQLQTENPRPLKVPKDKAKRKPYFEEGDILAVKFQDEYGLVFVSMVEQSPRKLEYHLACTRLLQTKKPTIDDFLTSHISCKMDNTKFALVTNCWFNHKDLGQLLENIEKIGQVKLRPFSLWMLAPAQNLEDIYEEITRDKGSSGLRFIETYKLVDDIFPV